MQPEVLQSRIYNLAAIAALLAAELEGRTIAPEDAARPSVLGVADHLAEQLAELRDRLPA